MSAVTIANLKNFHAPSHAAAIFPVLCATDAPKDSPVNGPSGSVARSVARLMSGS
jgi:hypothetical protein